MVYHLVLSWLQGLCAISCTGQTVTYCHGSVPNVIHFPYLTPAVIKCIVPCIDGTLCNVATHTVTALTEGQSHVVGV